METYYDPFSAIFYLHTYVNELMNHIECKVA